jgi:DNA replication protein DnaC
MSRDRRDVEDRVRTLLEAFRMKRALDVLASVLPADKPGRTQSLETFERLLRAELDDRRERRIARRLDDSHLPDRPTLETFDFAFQPKLDKALVLDLAQLAWVDRKDDLVLVGEPGVGKSHITKALCVLAAGQERRVLYYLGHPQLTMALLDKLLFRATAIRIDGPSYRLDQHKKRKAARASNKPEDGTGSDRESSS